MRATKKPVSVAVEFATEDGTLQTLEGPVRYRAGDALATGVRGERWPIPRETFLASYSPEPGVATGAPGSYVKQPVEVDAVRMDSPFSVEIEGGMLTGSAGDWLVTAADGSQWIVRDDVFRESYVMQDPLDD